jgi:hypothetical protein
MMKEFDPERVTLKVKKITGLSASAYLMPDFLNWGKVLFSFRGYLLSHW